MKKFILTVLIIAVMLTIAVPLMANSYSTQQTSELLSVGIMDYEINGSDREAWCGVLAGIGVGAFMFGQFQIAVAAALIGGAFC